MNNLKCRSVVYPSRHLDDHRFKYRKAVDTDIRHTFRKFSRFFRLKDRHELVRSEQVT